MQPQNPYQQPYQPPAPQPQPQSQFPQPQPHSANPADYEFIFSPQKKTKVLPRLNLRGNKLFMMVAVLLVPLIILGAYSLFSGGGDNNIKLMTSVAQKQTEIVRIADIVLAQNNLKQETKTIATNVRVTINSNLEQLSTYMTNNGNTLNAKDLQLAMDSSIDDNLGKANQSGNLDSAYLTLLKTQLSDYNSALTEAYKATTGPNGQKVLSDAFDNVALLTKQLN